MKRDYSMEAYRVFLMFGICLLHSITQAGHNTAWTANMLEWCVPGFMFLSGWFGIKFSFGKVLKLYGISYYCAVIYVVFDATITGSGVDGSCIIRAYRIAKGQWFLNAYVIVMCFAPIVNLAIERMTIRDLLPLVLCAFGWSFATTLPVLSLYVPKAAGLKAFSFLSLLGAYVVARYVRRLYDSNEWFRGYARNMKIVLLMIGFCLFFAAIGCGDYNSPFALLIAGCALLAFRVLHMPDSIGKICSWLGPSMFSVYLIHSHGFGWGYLKCIQEFLLGKGFPLFTAYFLTALTIFCVCIVADFPRRGIAILLRKGR